MFTTQQNVQWWALRWKFARSWKHTQSRVVSDMRTLHYSNVLIAAFTHLFNHRLKVKP